MNMFTDKNGVVADFLRLHADEEFEAGVERHSKGGWDCTVDNSVQAQDSQGLPILKPK